MSKNSAIIYLSEKIPNINILNNIYLFVKNELNVTDIGLVYNKIPTEIGYHYAVLPNYYLRFHKGYIIFTDIDDYLEYRTIIIGKPILYLQDIPKNISRNTLANCCLLTINSNNKIEMIKNDQLP
jgi:hypothetical protein